MTIEHYINTTLFQPKKKKKLDSFFKDACNNALFYLFVFWFSVIIFESDIEIMF